MNPYISNKSISAILHVFLLIHSTQCFSYDADLQSKVNNWQIECMDETKVDPMQVLITRTGFWTVPAFDGTIQKWALCILVKAGIMSPDGVFKLDKANELVPPYDRHRVLSKIDHCLYKTKHTPPEIAWEYLKCYNKKEPRKFKII